jgi:hypothetical protein
MVAVKMDKLAAEHADWVDKNSESAVAKRGSLRIVNIEYGAARELCIELGIAKLPTIHMYMPAVSPDTNNNNSVMMTRVQDFSCSPREFHRVKDLTASYLKQQARAAAATTAKASPVKKDAFEAKLDAGRDLIQARLAAELPAAAAQFYADAAVAAAVNEEPKKRFWRRFRKNSQEE